MVDLKGQYAKIQSEIDQAVIKTIRSSNYINGPEVSQFQNNLSTYLGVPYVVPCANGTDALQVALMSLELNPGDEIIVPSFTYVASAEVIGLLGFKAIMVDVDPDDFNISLENIMQAFGPKTRAVIVVHLFGQCCNMEPILDFCNSSGVYVIEDAAQAIGAEYTFSDGSCKKAGTMGFIGCTSFFPSKNLGCFGDGGAIFTSNPEVAAKLKMLTNHGQIEKYVHKYLGVNSRLDSIQASILNVKLKYLNQYNAARNLAADRYNKFLTGIEDIVVPVRRDYSTHVFHQYTIKMSPENRDNLKIHLEKVGVSSMIYYPIPLHHQEAFKNSGETAGPLKVTENLCSSVLSLPLHTELEEEQQLLITDQIKQFFTS